MIFQWKTLNGIAPLKCDWYQASNPLKMQTVGHLVGKIDIFQ